MNNMYPLILIIGGLLVAYIVFVLLLKHLSNMRGQILDNEILFMNELLVRNLDSAKIKNKQYKKKMKKKDQEISHSQEAWQEKNNQLHRECKLLQEDNEYLRSSYHKDQEQVIFTKRDLKGLRQNIYTDFLMNLEKLNNQSISDGLKDLVIYEEEQRYKLVERVPFLFKVADGLSFEELSSIDADFIKLNSIFQSDEFATFLKYGNKEQKAQFIEQVIKKEALNQVSSSLLRFSCTKIKLEKFPTLIESFQNLYAYMSQAKVLKFILADDCMENTIREEAKKISVLTNLHFEFETDILIIKGMVISVNNHRIDRTLQRYFYEYMYELEGVS